MQNTHTHKSEKDVPSFQQKNKTIHLEPVGLPNSANTCYMTKFVGESGIFKVTCKGQLASLQTSECLPFKRIDKIICTRRFYVGGWKENRG